MYYNQTKGGAVTLDQMCSLMSCSRMTSITLLYGMMNMTSINDYIILLTTLAAEVKRLLL